MSRTIWDLKKGDTFKLKEGLMCRGESPTEDGKGLVGVYLEGELRDKPDFVFEDEIDFQDP